MTRGGKREGAGRPKGSLNKTTRDAKETIWNVFERLGGEEALYEWAKENLSDFNLKMFLKLAPTTTDMKADIKTSSYEDYIAQLPDDYDERKRERDEEFEKWKKDNNVKSFIPRKIA